MSHKVTIKPASVGFGGLLAIVFITLKLCGVIQWSWLWVLAPLWIPVLITIAILGVVFGIILISEIRK